MTEIFLEKILSVKRERVAAAKRIVPFARIHDMALEGRSGAESHRLRSALQNTGRINIIAEIKRASPSKGAINTDIDVAATAGAYMVGGACAISVLTEEDFFQGSLEDLDTVRRSVDLPILRKDFVFDEYQIYEAAAARADAVLLIVAALSPDCLGLLYETARGLGLDALVEVHNLEELRTARDIDAELIGVNNRNLRTFEVSLDVSRELVTHKPNGSLIISESGLSTPDELAGLRDLGFDGFLIGETLMRSNSPGAALKDLTAV